MNGVFKYSYDVCEIWTLDLVKLWGPWEHQ